MLPGYVAGHYHYDEVHIDLRRLAEFAGARFFRTEAIGINRHAHTLQCSDRPAIPYDRLSINIGSTPKLNDADGESQHAVAVKPIHQFNARWLALLARVQNQPGPMHIALVGGGAGGVELLLAMQYRLRQELTAQGQDPDALRFSLFTRGPSILPTHNVAVQRRFTRTLKARGVTVHVNSAVQAVSADGLSTVNGDTHTADEVIWVTRAGGARWLEDTGLALDADGFIEVTDTLQTKTDPDIFAAGDIATMVNHPREKAGVFAVRQGLPLAQNLRRSLEDKPLRHYHPQRRWLALISTGNQYAVASRGAFSMAGAWLWRCKDHIDRRFMARFTDLPAMSPTVTQSPRSSVALEGEEAQQAISAVAMRCGGCGAKVGASTLSRALGALSPIDRDDVVIGLHAPDDAAVVRVPPGKAMVHTVDFFRAFIDDPYVFGQIAANHALGDIFAMGADAQTATAVATVPQGLEAKVEDTVFQMMSGALAVLNDANCALVGGHTGEGQELALGFAINGLIDDRVDNIMRKGGMQPGDVLVLTKPIGTGTLFAAHAQLQARGRWIDEALQSMRHSNRLAADCLHRFSASACTDLTGFGLLGHLVEMTRPSEVDAHIDLSALPILDGAEQTVAAGILSSLQPANVRLRRAIRNAESVVNHGRYPLVFDPQTAGGLLASVPAKQADACVHELISLGYPQTTIIGAVHPQGDALEPIELKG
jgi:selenide,water dikinase